MFAQILLDLIGATILRQAASGGPSVFAFGSPRIAAACCGTAIRMSALSGVSFTSFPPNNHVFLRRQVAAIPPGTPPNSDKVARLGTP